MATNYANWTVAKLKKERDKIDNLIERKSGKEKQSLIAKVKKMAADNGFEITELFSGDEGSPAPARKKRAVSKKKAAGKKRASKKGRGGKRGAVPQIYRNPENHGETWSGRGRAPRWMADHIASGGDKEDLRFA